MRVKFLIEYIGLSFDDALEEHEGVIFTKDAI